MEKVPESCICYPVRTLKAGEVTYFNFELAKQMGLIPADHPRVLNAQLKQVLLDTFCLRIVNEFDLKTRKGFQGETVKPNKYMATRYLQLQHPNKQGKTSGDGRSIWNGQVTCKGVTWDVSSRGTGVTKLAPGVIEAGQPLKTGSTKFGYGCGLADLDELYSAAIMSEIFARQGVPTERVLCVISIGDGQGIGVRAHQNLIRPAHFFMYLKQGDSENLRKVVDLFIERQVANRVWDITRGQSRYVQLCHYVAKSFAQLAARLEVDYIFVWMDWDGDNILADGSIIDYGSVRQFGMRHDQYRYDDFDRFSTNLNEQRLKAREIVQTFVQMADFLKTGRKKPVADFARARELQFFDEVFEDCRRRHLLYRVGMPGSAIDRILYRHLDKFESFEEVFHFFEKKKSSHGELRVPDGINRPAIYNMREVLRELPTLLIDNDCRPVPSEVLFELMVSSFAKREDRKMTPRIAERLQDLQRCYLDLIESVRGRRGFLRYLGEIHARGRIINRHDRITGNAVTVVVEEIMEQKLSPHEIQTALDVFIASQTTVAQNFNFVRKQLPKGFRPKIFKRMLEVVKEFREDI